MQKVSEFFKRPKDAKHKASLNGKGFEALEHGSSSGNSSKGPPRLVRSPVIKVLRKPQDGIGEARHSLDELDEHIERPNLHSLSSSNSNARNSSSNDTQILSPLPSPLPRPPEQPNNHSRKLFPLPSPEAIRRRDMNLANGLKNLKLEHTGNGIIPQLYTYKGKHHRIDNKTVKPKGKHNLQIKRTHCSSPNTRCPSPSQSPQEENYGQPWNELHGEHKTNTHAIKATLSTPNSGYSSPVLEEWESRQLKTGHEEPSTSTNSNQTAISSPSTRRSICSPTAISPREFVPHKSVAVKDPSETSYDRSNNQATQNSHSSNERIVPGSNLPPPLLPLLGSTPKSVEKSESASTWQKGRLLGCGAFGRVYKGIHSETGEFCAIKEVEFVEGDSKSKACAEQLEKEIAILSSLKHQNIVQYKGSDLSGNSLYIYLELISGGSLHNLHQEFKKLKEPIIRRYTRQILKGIEFLHSRRTIHRDIKCANILVDHDGKIKLADFGLAKYIKEQGVPFSLKGSPFWMAPEVIMQKNTGYEYAVDIWSLGCTVVEMVTGKPPWGNLESAAAMFKITKGYMPPLPDSLSPEGQNFVKLCLQKNPADRPSATMLLEHPFVQIPDDNNHAINLSDMFDTEESMMSSPTTTDSTKYPFWSAPPSPKSTNNKFGRHSTRSGPLMSRYVVGEEYNAQR